MIRFEIDEKTGETDTKITNDVFMMVSATTYFISLVYNEYHKRGKAHGFYDGNADLFKLSVQRIIANDNSPTWEIDEEE